MPGAPVDGAADKSLGGLHVTTTPPPPTPGSATVGATDGSIVEDLRFAANRHVFRVMLASSGAAAVIMHRILPRRHWLLPDHGTVWSFARLQARNLARVCGVEVVTSGLEHLTAGGPYVFTPNHQSHFDIPALLGHLPGENRFATKKELFRDPILGPVIHTLGMVPIDRENPAAAIQAMRERAGMQCSLIVFPEGTRGSPERLLPFKKGAFVAAIELGIPIVPVTIRGSAAVMPRGGYLGIRPGRIDLCIGRPIPTDGLTYDDRNALRDRVRAIIAGELGIDVDPVPHHH